MGSRIYFRINYKYKITYHLYKMEYIKTSTCLVIIGVGSLILANFVVPAITGIVVGAGIVAIVLGLGLLACY